MENVIVGVVAACIGWWVVHYLATKRDVENKKRELRISHLIVAFNKLNQLRTYASSLEITEICQILVDISNVVEIFGNEEQVSMFKELATSATEKRGVLGNIVELVDNVRDDLRSMLQLKASVESVSYLVMQKPALNVKD